MYRNGFGQTCNWRGLCRVRIGILASAFRVLKYFQIWRYFHVSKSHGYTLPPNRFIGLATSQSDVYQSDQSPLTCQCALLRKISRSVRLVAVFADYVRTSHPFLKCWARSQFAVILACVTNNGKLCISIFKDVLAQKQLILVLLRRLLFGVLLRRNRMKESSRFQKESESIRVLKRIDLHNPTHH